MSRAVTSFPLRGLLGLAVLFVVVLALPAWQEPTPEELVKQLSDPQFKVRAQAAQKLEQLGAKAIPALQQATKDANPEVARRAKELLERLEKQGEMDLILQATQVRLDVKNEALADVVKELARQSDYKIKLDKAVDGQKRITVQLGEVPFWQAFDAVCQAAEVKLGKPDHKADKKEDDDDQAIKLPPRPAFPGMQNLPPGFNPNQLPNMNLNLNLNMMGAGGAPAHVPATLTLVPGKPASGPVTYSGALAIRAVPVKEASNENIREHKALLLEIRAEPKVGWRSALDARIGTLQDEKGQNIEVSRVELSNQDGAGAGGDDNPVGLNANPQFASEKLPFAQELAVLLRLPDAPGKQVPNLKGVISGQVQGKRLPVIAIADPTQEKTQKNKAGDELTVLGFKTLPDGDVELQVELKTTAAAGMAGNQQIMMQGNFQVQINGNVLRGGRMRLGGSPAGQSEVQLYDDQGKPYGMSMSNMQMNTNRGGERVARYSFRCEAPRDGSKPGKLTYETDKPTTFELPFNLKGVPLP